MPHKSAVPLEWRLKKSRYNMIGSKCPKTQELYFPPRKISKIGEETEDYKFSGRGEIVSYTSITSPPAGFEEYSPYVVAIIKLEEGVMLSAQIINPIEEIAIGKKVLPVFRKLNEDGESGLIRYGIKFEIVD